MTHKSVGGDEAQWEFDDVLNSDLLFASWQTVFSGLVTLSAFPGSGSGNQEMSVVGCFARRRFPSGKHSSVRLETYKKRRGGGGKFGKHLVMRYLLKGDKLFAEANSPISLLGAGSLLRCMKQGLYLFTTYFGEGIF